MQNVLSMIKSKLFSISWDNSWGEIRRVYVCPRALCIGTFNCYCSVCKISPVLALLNATLDFRVHDLFWYGAPFGTLVSFIDKYYLLITLFMLRIGDRFQQFIQIYTKDNLDISILILILFSEHEKHIMVFIIFYRFFMKKNPFCLQHCSM